MKEWHHKVPSFLGGSNEKWNLEYITIEEHLQRHVDIAEEIDTHSAWACCISITRGHPELLTKYIRERYGKSTSGEKHPGWKGGRNCSKCKKRLFSRRNINCRPCRFDLIPPAGKKVICIKSGVIYTSIKAAAKSIGISYKRLYNRVTNIIVPNDTSIRSI